MAAPTGQPHPVRRRHRRARRDLRPHRTEPVITIPELTQLSPHVFAFTAGHSNAYLWRHGDGVTLVDTGEAGHEELIEAAVRRIGGQLVRIVLTHWHHDHTGGAAATANRTGANQVGAQVCAGRADAPVIRGDRTGDPPALTAAEEPLMANISGLVTPAPPCVVHRELDDGDTLPRIESVSASDASDDPGEAGDAGIIVGTPGHTPGSIAVYLPGERVVLTGDIAAHFDADVVLGPFNTNREQAKNSLRRLTALDIDAVGFGHGAPITHGAADALAAWTYPFD